MGSRRIGCRLETLFERTLDLDGAVRMDMASLRTLGLGDFSLRKVALGHGARLVLDPHNGLGTELGGMVLRGRLLRLGASQLLWTPRSHHQ